jgi:CheY-like chemotaxis protein
MQEAIRNILVIEENVDAREAIAAFLEGEGYHVVGAASGREALVQLRTALIFCVVLLDLGMPTMDGWEFQAEQPREPAIASIPVVIVSLEGLLQRDDTAPAAVFPKPVGWGHLLETVQQHC